MAYNMKIITLILAISLFLAGCQREFVSVRVLDGNNVGIPGVKVGGGYFWWDKNAEFTDGNGLVNLKPESKMGERVITIQVSNDSAADIHYSSDCIAFIEYRLPMNIWNILDENHKCLTLRKLAKQGMWSLDENGRLIPPKP